MMYLASHELPNDARHFWLHSFMSAAWVTEKFELNFDGKAEPQQFKVYSICSVEWATVWAKS